MPGVRRRYWHSTPALDGGGSRGRTRFGDDGPEPTFSLEPRRELPPKIRPSFWKDDPQTFHRFVGIMSSLRATALKRSCAPHPGRTCPSAACRVEHAHPSRPNSDGHAHPSRRGVGIARYAHSSGSGTGMSCGRAAGREWAWGGEPVPARRGQDRAVRVSSTASGRQAIRTGAKREVPMPAETFTGVVRPRLSQFRSPRARQVGRSQLETRAP